MTTQTDECPSELIDAFLRDELSHQDTNNLESHLDTCEVCQQRLDSSVASDEQWHELRNSLSTGGPASTIVLDGGKLAVERREDLSFYRRMLSPSDDPKMLGRIGSYEIVGLLGHGGMGVVFKGLDPSLNRYVAIKMMAPQFAASGAARQRFSREAQAAAAVVHEHVMAIHSVAQWQDTPYLVMPYVRGTSLQKRIDDEGALQLREVLRIGYQVASGLAAAHAQGLIHRDVKPANILLEQDVERVVLSDFGLARAVDDIRLTRTDTLVGTPQYMSPEQSNDQSLDYRTDLFSLGSVMYEMATGRPAFQAVTSYGVLRKINDTEPHAMQDLNSDIPEWLVRIVQQLMAKDPEKRFQSASEVADLLQRCLSHVEQPHLTTLPTEISTESSSPPLKMKYVMLATALTAGLAVTSFMFAFPGGSPAPAENPEPEGAGVSGAVGTVADQSDEYATAAQAYQVGAAFAAARDYKRCRKPLEAAAKMSDDIELKMRAYQALIPCYRQVPEFEPFRDAAEFIIDNHYHGAAQSNMRTTFMSFAHNRGQMNNLVKRYEKRLKKDGDNWLAVFMLSEIYAGSPVLRSGNANPKRAIELLNQLAELDAERAKDPSRNWSSVPASSLINPAAPSRHRSKIAAQYAALRDHKNAAVHYEKAADLYEPTRAHNLKDAASSALKAGDKKEALRLALAAEEAPEDSRGDQILHHIHRRLGDIFMELERPKKSIPHYEKAIEKTKISGYLKDTKASLLEAKEKAAE